MEDRASMKKVDRNSSKKFVASEVELLRILRAPLDRGPRPKTLLLENGHDAAVLSGFTQSGLAATVDRIVEDVHFRFQWSDPRSVAAKVFASNVSDLVAVGARPIFGLLSLTFSDAPLSVAFVRSLGQAFAGEARRYGLKVVGGNVTRARGPFTADLVALGSVVRRPFRRDALRPGMAVFALGNHGDAAAGLSCLEHFGSSAAVPRAFRPLLRAQLLPRVNLAVLDALGRARRPVASMDTSDGLAFTVATVAKESGCAVDLELDALRPSARLRAAAEALGVDASRWILAGGEDYGLVVGLAPGDVAPVTRALAARRIPWVRLGTARRGRGLHGGGDFADAGWDPFR